jgi:prepilin-type N-terminal cleavage/methylation domain-containing protein
MEHHFLKHSTKGLPVGRQGFTLIELLISIAIIGILISVAVASYSSAQKKARDSRRMSDLKAIQGGFEQYYADFNGNYPNGCALGPKYLPAGFPNDPKPGSTYTQACIPTGYCFCASLESTTGNATANTCTETVTPPPTYSPSYGSGQFFCVTNLQ